MQLLSYSVLKHIFPKKKKCYQCTSPQEFLLFSFGPKICRPEYFCGFIITKLLAYSLTFPVLLRWLRGGCTLFVIEASSATFVFLKQVKHFISCPCIQHILTELPVISYTVCLYSPVYNCNSPGRKTLLSSLKLRFFEWSPYQFSY